MQVDQLPASFFDDDDPDPRTEAVRAVRNRNIVDGQLALAVACLLAETSPRECLSARSLVAAEIGPALGLGSGAATKLVDIVIALRARLRVTFTELRAGRLCWYLPPSWPNATRR